MALSVAGCGGGGKGGATTCGEYLEMSDADQEKVIRQFIKEKGDDDPPRGEVALGQLGALTHCNTIGRSSDPVRDIDG